MMHKFFHRSAAKPATLIIVALFTACLWQLATAAWIQGKAIVAQQLLDHAWQQTVNDAALAARAGHEQQHRPWPWADTWPVARLVAPQYAIELIVLAGDSGSSLAFGPGYAFASAKPNSGGLTMISGHRDTHFRFLKDLRLNDRLDLQTAEKTLHYRVTDFQIVDSRRFTLPAGSDENTLVLVTCYPFDAITAGGPLRYLVYAQQQPI
jgi:sortase A